VSVDTHLLPAWIRELDMALTVYPQILLTGNVRDRYLLPDENDPQGRGLVPYGMADVIESVCRKRAYGALASHDVISERMVIWQLGSGEAGELDLPPALTDMAGVDARRPYQDGRDRHEDQDGGKEPDFDRLRRVLVEVVRHRGPAIGLLIPYAGRLGSPHGALDEEGGRFFAAAEALGHTALQVPGRRAVMPFNTVFWVVEKQEELPVEFAVGSRSVRVITVPSPPHDQRLAAAQHVVGGLVRQQAVEGGETATAGEAERAAETLARASHGMGSSEVMAIGRMAVDRKIPLARLDEAARLYRVGVIDNPWAARSLREKIAHGEEHLNAQVLGQPHAVRRVIQIFKRSAAGLTGAQSSSSPNRPRGTLFLSGPTGVGKTELAKGVATMILGSDARPIRFDMSEFAEEHARERLIGAPPGFVGHSAGGELTNAVRTNPMSVLLFDEIEKAHHRLFDLFLQILEDGRLTDGRGATVYFTECVLIFTSNLGVSRGQGPEAHRLSRQDDPETVRAQLREAFDVFFDEGIRRPELRNRFGDTFVPMDFIQEETVPAILDKALASVTGRVLEVHGAVLEMAPTAWKTLYAEAVERLAHGGRGLLTAVESALVNPLSRELFDLAPEPGETITVEAIFRDGDTYTVAVSRCHG
jgi:hypothetical protein